MSNQELHGQRGEWPWYYKGAMGTIGAGFAPLALDSIDNFSIHDRSTMIALPITILLLGYLGFWENKYPKSATVTAFMVGATIGGWIFRDNPTFTSDLILGLGLMGIVLSGILSKNVKY